MSADTSDEQLRLQVLEQDLDRLRNEVTGLRRALESRARIEQAKGGLMAMTGCSEDEAFAQLKSLAQRENRRLLDIAEELVSALRMGGVAIPQQAVAQADGGRSVNRADAGSANTEADQWRPRVEFPWRLKSVRRPDQLRALADLADLLATAGTTAEVERAVAQRGMAALGARAGGLAVLEQDGWLRSRRYGFPAGAQEFGDVPLSADVPRAVCVRTNEAIFLRTREEILERFPGYEILLDTQALAVVPVISDEHVTLGALGLSYDTPQEFGAGTRAFLEYAAHQCAVALRRVRQ